MKKIFVKIGIGLARVTLPVVLLCTLLVLNIIYFCFSLVVFLLTLTFLDLYNFDKFNLKVLDFFNFLFNKIAPMESDEKPFRHEK